MTTPPSKQDRVGIGPGLVVGRDPFGVETWQRSPGDAWEGAKHFGTVIEPAHGHLQLGLSQPPTNPDVNASIPATAAPIWALQPPPPPPVITADGTMVQVCDGKLRAVSPWSDTPTPIPMPAGAGEAIAVASLTEPEQVFVLTQQGTAAKIYQLLVAGDGFTLAPATQTPVEVDQATDLSVLTLDDRTAYIVADAGDGATPGCLHLVDVFAPAEHNRLYAWLEFSSDTPPPTYEANAELDPSQAPAATSRPVACAATFDPEAPEPKLALWILDATVTQAIEVQVDTNTQDLHAAALPAPQLEQVERFSTYPLFGAWERAPLAAIPGPLGVRYRSVPDAGLVLVQAPGQAAPTPLPDPGPCPAPDASALPPGFGVETPEPDPSDPPVPEPIDEGAFVSPRGVALDQRGLLYVADYGDPDSEPEAPGKVLVIIAATGRRLFLVTEGAPEPEEPPADTPFRPIDVAIAQPSGAICILDEQAQSVSVFDPDFRFVRRFAVPTPPPYASESSPDWVPEARALAADPNTPDGLLYGDAAWPRLLQISLSGEVQGEISARASESPRFEPWVPRAACTPTGSALFGPFDLRTEDALWHEVIVDAHVPPHTQIELRTYASNEPGFPQDTHTHTHVNDIPWAPQHPVPVAPADLQPHTDDRRLVLAWQGDPTSEDAPKLARERAQATLRGTDRGRYLWVLATLKATPAADRWGRPQAWASASPSLHALRVRGPRPQGLDHLPDHWRAPDPGRLGDNFADRFLTLAIDPLDHMERLYEDVARRLDPHTAPDSWLDALGAAIGWTFDPSWEPHHKRALLVEGALFATRRGTRSALERLIHIYTGVPPTVIESFQCFRPGWRRPLGKLSIGTSILGPRCATVHDAPPSRATVYVYMGQVADFEASRASVDALIQQQTPDHALVDVRVVIPDARVGMQSTVGVDLVAGSPAGDPCLPSHTWPVGTQVIWGLGPRTPNPCPPAPCEPPGLGPFKPSPAH